VAGLLMCAMLSPAVPTAMGEGPSALGAVRLDEADPRERAEPGDRGAEPVEAASPEATEPSTATDAPPAQEGMGLGQPNGFLSARPSGNATGGESGNAAWWAMLDPRQNEMLRVIIALAVVIGLLLAVRVMLRKGVGIGGVAGRPSGVLQILARFPIARGQSLVVLQLGRRIVLLHQSSAGMRTLSEVTDPDEVANLLGRMEAGSSGREAERFGSLLKRFQMEHERLGEGRRAGAGSGPRGGVTTRDRIRGVGGARRADENEVIDLTRGGGMLGRLFGAGGRN
jgi:flagellar biogenesis protein FliO